MRELLYLWMFYCKFMELLYLLIYIMCDFMEKVLGLELLQEEIEDVEEEIVS